MKKAFLQLHIAVFLAGFTGILGRLITLNEGMIVWYRLLLTSITMWILFGLMKKLQKIPVIDILKIAGVGFIAAMHWVTFYGSIKYSNCLLYTSDAADERSSVDLGGRRIIKKKQ